MKRQGSPPTRRKVSRRRPRNSIFAFYYDVDEQGKVRNSPLQLWDGMKPVMAKHWWDYYLRLALVFLLIVTGGTLANVYFALTDAYKLQFLQQDPHIFDAPWERPSNSDEIEVSPDNQGSGAEGQVSGHP